MARIGGSPPIFEGRNFSYWKARMGANLDAIAPEVWHATKQGFTSDLSTDSDEYWLARVVVFGISRLDVGLIRSKLAAGSNLTSVDLISCYAS